MLIIRINYIPKVMGSQRKFYRFLKEMKFYTTFLDPNLNAFSYVCFTWSKSFSQRQVAEWGDTAAFSWKSNRGQGCGCIWMWSLVHSPPSCTTTARTVRTVAWIASYKAREKKRKKWRISKCYLQKIYIQCIFKESVTVLQLLH